MLVRCRLLFISIIRILPVSLFEQSLYYFTAIYSINHVWRNQPPMPWGHDCRSIPSEPKRKYRCLTVIITRLNFLTRFLIIYYITIIILSLLPGHRQSKPNKGRFPDERCRDISYPSKLRTYQRAHRVSWTANCWKIHIIDTFRKYGDICNTSQSLPPLHEFRLNMNQCGNPGLGTQMEFELPAKLDLGVSETGVIGRQVTIREGASILGIGVVGYN